MYLSDNELVSAIASGKLIFEPPPKSYDPSSIDLQLDRVDEAKIWDVEKLAKHHHLTGGLRPEVNIGQYNYSQFSKSFLVAPPEYDVRSEHLVQKRGNQVVVRRGGFVLWQTLEKVGTPIDDPELICFVNAKSTKARSGIMVHLTAPTIHPGWSGQITLEIANVGPFDLVLQQGDIIAQLTVARITSSPKRQMASTSQTFGQQGVDGKAKL